MNLFMSLRGSAVRLRTGVWLLCVMVLFVAHSLANAAVSDADFAKGELSRIARGKLKGNQAQTLNVAERFQRNKAGQTKSDPMAATAASASPGADEQSTDWAGSNVATENSSLPANSHLLDAGNGLSPEECSRRVSALQERKPEKNILRQAQSQLRDIGLYDYTVDGIFGQKTVVAFQRFCEEARYAVADDLFVMLYKHAEIARKQPRWNELLSSHEFRRWAGVQADTLAIGTTLDSGSAAGVIAVIERFKKRKIDVPIGWAGDALVSYSLSKEDIARLKSPIDMVKAIAGLQSKLFASEADFDSALEVAFKGVSSPERYLTIVKRYAEPITGLMITDESLKRLKIKKLPDAVLALLQGIKGLHYPATELSLAVEEALGPLDERFGAVKAEEIVKLAEIKSSGVQLTADSVKKFVAAGEKDDPAIAMIAARLQRLAEIEYSSSKTMTIAMRNVLKQVRDESNAFIPMIVAESEASTTFSISDDSVERIARDVEELAVPEIYLDMLAELQDVDYPSPELFWQAAKAKVSMVGPNHRMKRAVMRPIESQLATTIDDAILARMREDKLPRTVVAQIATLKNKPFDSVVSLKEAIEEMFLELSESFDIYRPLVAGFSRKVHKFDKSKEIQWSGGKCNCVHTKLSGDVYGFYPYWLAGEKQEIDFSLTTRIGYVGIGFDDHGELPDAARWTSLNTDFIRQANTYGTKVDLVVQRMNWKTWPSISASDKAAAFNKLADNIVQLVTIPLGDSFSEAKPYLSLGLSHHPVMGDGVTLYFEDYPQDASSIDAFRGLILSLRDHFRVLNREFDINVMFRSSELGSGVYSMPRLAELRRAVSDKYLNIRFLILLQEPTTLDKKVLRTTIEDGLGSVDRKKLLRSVVMVTTYDGKDEPQMNADVIFAENNFGGIGFWHQPYTLAGEAANPAIRNALTKWYLTAVTDSTLQNAELCRYVCPNRWAFRIVWASLLLLVIGCTALYFAVCEVRPFMERHFIWLVALLFVPMFLNGMALMSCDPGWAEISHGNDVLTLVVIGVIAYAIWNYWNKRQQAELP